MFDLMSMMQGLQEKIGAAKNEMDNIHVVGEAANGAVKITLSASKKMVNVAIDPSVVANGNAEELEDLISIALENALTKAEAKAEEVMSKAKGDILPPGFDLPGF